VIEAMRLRILLPTRVLLDEKAVKVIADAENGSFCLLPRHVDFVAALPPGVLTFETPESEEVFVGLAEATLIKCGGEVEVATFNGVRGTDLSRLRQHVEGDFLRLSEREASARSALDRLEAGVVRRFMDLQRTSS
jgi:F-type H+-transporting ATPase subunit epsilon